MKAFSRFSWDDLTPSPDGSKSPLPSDWYQEAEDEKFRLSLAQTRAELAEALRYKQAFHFLLQGMEEIASANSLPPIQKRTAERYLRLLAANWPRL